MPNRSTKSCDKFSSGGSANIRVAVRVRPENEREKAGAYNNVINVVDDKMLIFDPKEDQDDFFYQGKKQGRRDLNKRENKDKKFAFDAVFAPGSTNQQVFEGTTKDLVETVFNGYNCSVFAYGATGAGKTFTMLGAKVLYYFRNINNSAADQIRIVLSRREFEIGFLKWYVVM